MRSSMSFGRAAIAALLFAYGAQAASAQTPPPVFDGAGFITETTGCTAGDGFVAPVPTNFVFRPAFSIPGLPEALQLNFIGKAAVLAVSTSSSGKLAGASSIETTGISYWSTAYGNGSKPGASKLTFTPKTIDRTTEFVTIAGTIKNLTGNANCTVTIAASLTRRP